MTNGRQSVPPNEWDELLDAAIENFLNWDLEFDQFRSKLAELGLPASEIEHMVDTYAPAREKNARGK